MATWLPASAARRYHCSASLKIVVFPEQAGKIDHGHLAACFGSPPGYHCTASPACPDSLSRRQDRPWPPGCLLRPARRYALHRPLPRARIPWQGKIDPWPPGCLLRQPAGTTARPLPRARIPWSRPARSTMATWLPASAARPVPHCTASSGVPGIPGTGRRDIDHGHLAACFGSPPVPLHGLLRVPGFPEQAGKIDHGHLAACFGSPAKCLFADVRVWPVALATAPTDKRSFESA